MISRSHASVSVFAKWVCLHEVHGRSSPRGFGTFLTVFTPHGPLVTTSSLNHGSRVPTTHRAGGCYISVECSRRGHESRGEELDYHTSQDCFWFRQYTSYASQGMFPTFLQRSIPDSHPARTRRLTKWSVSSSGYCAPTYVEHLTMG